jgi:hypothetical protein
MARRAAKSHGAPKNRVVGDGPPVPPYSVHLGSNAVPERTRPVEPGPACHDLGAQTGPRKPAFTEGLRQGVDTGLGKEGLGDPRTRRPFQPPRRTRQAPARPGGRG